MLSQTELKLSKLISLTHLDDPAVRARTLKIDDSKYEEKLLSKSMSDVRIKLGDDDQDAEDDEDDFDDQMDGDVWNRKHVKYNSEQILEKQQAKNRKRAKKKA